MIENEKLQKQVEELQEKLKDTDKKLAKSEKVKRILMERVERSVDSSGDSYSMFERNILLQQHIEKRTKELADVNKKLIGEIEERKQIGKELEKSRDAAEAASRAKSDFLANMSHEIRTPMNAILGMADLLWESPLDQEQKKYVQVFKNSGEHLLQLINDILDVSKVEAGHLELENTCFDLDELIGKTGEVMAMRAHGKGLELTCQITDDVPVHLMGDSSRLRQIFVNLIGNAIKFTEEGEVSLDVRRSTPVSDVDNTVELLFAVTDTGIGIKPEKQEAIFDSFTQAEFSTTREYGGTGLGLTISKWLVELMGGRIWAESQLGEGSTFSFVISFEVVEVSPEERAIHIPKMNMEGTKVLAIDDNETNRLILRKTLSRWGAQLTEAADGWHGLAELERARAMDEPYELVLLDCRMPGMGGFEVAERMKDKPDLAGVTIMMLTSDHRPGDPEKARELGVACYLVKPVRRSDLREAISTAMGQAAERSEKPVFIEAATVPADHLPLRILLVEDHENNRMVIQAYLKNTPYQLDMAENGKIACRKLISEKYDLVLMDMQMPVMDGYAATRWIRDWEKKQQKEPTPIVALTAHALVEDAQKCLDAGCVAYLSKPVRKATLLEAIVEYTVPAPADRPSEPAKEDITPPEAAQGEKDRIIVHVDEAFRDFVPRFLELTSEDMKSMDNALNDGDYETVQRLGHSMKGSGGSFGFDAMTDIGKSIEAAAKAGDGEDIRKRLSELADYIERVEVVFGEK